MSQAATTLPLEGVAPPSVHLSVLTFQDEEENDEKGTGAEAIAESEMVAKEDNKGILTGASFSSVLLSV